MSSVMEAPGAASPRYGAILRWLPVALGLLVMYIPTYQHMWMMYWHNEDNAHGPLIVAVAVWLMWRRREVLLEPPQHVKPLLGGLLIAFALICYVIGRSQSFAQPDAFSQIPLLLGLLLVLQGERAFRALLFPVAFL